MGARARSFPFLQRGIGELCFLVLRGEFVQHSKNRRGVPRVSLLNVFSSAPMVTLAQKGEEAATEQKVKDKNIHYFPQLSNFHIFQLHFHSGL